MLQLGPAVKMPLQAVTETFGLLAVRGAGKSNAAAVMAEEMFKAKLPFVAVDPVRAWWGLRSSRDGKGPGLPIPIFGGRRGDVPLHRGSGQLIADLIVEHRLSCVLDVSEWESEAAKKEFLLAFARRLYERNEQPLHLFLEEADDYIPQKPMRDEAQLLRAWENIVRRGRNRGLGVTLITQRSAALNKNVLTQVQTLMPMRTTGPQDIAAIREWVRYHQQGEALLASLPELEDGEAWVWSPHFLRTMTRVRFRRRETFDSGATPDVRTAGKAPATLADVDLASIKTRMAATIEKAKADDPRELRAEVARLKGELAKAKSPAVTRDVTRRVEVPVLKPGELKPLQAALGRLETAFPRLHEIASTIGSEIAPLRVALERVESASRAPARPAAGPARAEAPKATHPTWTHRGFVRLDSLRVGVSKEPRDRILQSLAWWRAAGIEQPTRQQVAFVAGYTVNGHFNNTLGNMRGDGLLEYPAGNLVRLTDAGSAAASPIQTAPSRDELIERVKAVLRNEPARRIFAVIVAAGRPLSREEAAAGAGYTVNGHFNNVLGSLRGIGVVDYPTGGSVALSRMFEALT